LHKNEEISRAIFPLFSISCEHLGVSFAFGVWFPSLAICGNWQKKRIFNSDDIVRKYEGWVNEHRYMIMAHEREKWVSEAGEWEYIAVKCAKRGNDVYVSRVNSRLSGIGRNVPGIQHDFHENPFTSILFVTLTYDTKICSFSEAWQQIGVGFNRYRANLRKKYGKFPDAYLGELRERAPHVHAILIFEEKKFRVFPSYEQNKNAELKLVWRIHEKDEFEAYGIAGKI
jgi:hypothetical protein